jgi:hypothetical protein
MRVISTQRGARFSGFLLLLGFTVAIVLVTGWFVARTQGARKLLAERLSDRIGLPVTIKDSRIGWPYALVLRDVATADFDAAGTPGIAVGELRVARRLFSWQLTLRHVTLRVKQDEAGVWMPLVAARIADLRQASAMDFVRLTGPVRQRLRLHVSDGSLDWLDAEGRTEASLRDVRFCMEPVNLPEQRDMTYYSFGIYAASGGAFGNARDLSWAWLTSDDLPYVELARSVRYESGNEVSDTESQVGGVDVE